MWYCHGCGAPSWLRFGNRVANITQRFFYNTTSSIDRTFKYRDPLNLLLVPLNVNDCSDYTKINTTEKHLSQEGLMETVGFEKAHFRMP